MSSPNMKEHIEHAVKQELIRAESVPSHQIDVEACEDYVTLRGIVHSAREKIEAQQVVQNHPEVRAVENQLTVDHSMESNDQETTLKIHRRLSESHEFSGQCLQVEVNSGKVTITGYVTDQEDRQKVTDVASSVTAVKSVQNLVMVNPDGVLANEEHCRAVRAALQRIVSMEGDELTVSVVDETAQVTGEVDQLWKKEAVETTIRRFSIMKVANDLIVR